MAIKAMFAVLASLISLSAYIPYLKSMFAGTTRPHVYTWLIWTITTGTAAVGVWYGSGGWGAVSATICAAFTFLLFLLSFKYGTKNITKSDGVVLLFALAAIGLWWQLHQPLLAIILVSAVDIFAYIPTCRKSWAEPWSEEVLPWMLWIGYGVFFVLALQSYNPLTLTFIVTTTILTNLVLIGILLYRRRVIPRPRLID